MSKEKKTSVFFNFVYSSMYQILLILLPLITTPYVSRILKAEGVGIYSYSYSIASVFALIGMLGVNNYGNRTIATYQKDRKKRSEAFWNIYAVQMTATTIVFAAYIIYIVFMCQEKYRVILIANIITILCSFTDISWYFFGMEKFKLTVIRNMIIKLITVACILLFVRKESDVLIYTLLVVGSVFISNLILWPFLKKEVDYVRPTLKEMVKHVPQMLLLFIPVLAISIYNKMDKVMLGMMSNISQNGLYENTERIINLPMGFISAFGTVMLPRVTSMYSQGEGNKTEQYLELSMEFVIFLSAAMTFGIAGIAKEFSPIFFGNGYGGVEILIIAISPVLLIRSWANVIRTQYLIPLHYDRIYVISVCLGAIVNLIVNWILIPKYAALGAVIGTIFAEMIVMLYQTAFVAKFLPIKKYFVNSIYYIISGGVMYLAIRLISKKVKLNPMGLVIEILIGGCTFILLCVPYFYIKHRKMVDNICRTILRVKKSS